jgi:hypothetical protein
VGLLLGVLGLSVAGRRLRRSTHGVSPHAPACSCFLSLINSAGASLGRQVVARARYPERVSVELRLRNATDGTAGTP